jgi:transcriptional regulator with XRE-family HTH domain
VLESAQIRAARGLLGWRQEDLSKASGVGTATIRRIEKSQTMTGYVSTLARIQAAFEGAGIQFIDDDENGGYGLRLAKKKRKR